MTRTLRILAVVVATLPMSLGCEALDSAGADAAAGTADAGAAAETPSTRGEFDVVDNADGWPQCTGKDRMPANPDLKVDPAATGYETVITNGGHVAMLIGPDRPACLTDEVAKSRLADLEDGLKDVVEDLGFPAFGPWRSGHYLNWVILNTGIPEATLPQNGGYQGNRWGHMTFESTPHNPCEWTEYEAGGALHETIHAIQSEMWAFNNEGWGWIHEAHNTYLGSQREAISHGKHMIGWGSAAVLQVPHIPIESMGLIRDDTVDGPADQGVEGKLYVEFYGIYRYGLEVFVMSLAQSMGRGFVNCLRFPRADHERWCARPDDYFSLVT